MPMKAFTKRDAASFSSATPAAAGYCDTMPLSRAAFSASMPILFGGRPGEPWSILMNGMPVLSSRADATRRISPMVAFSRSAMFSSLTISATRASGNTLLSAIFLSDFKSPEIRIHYPLPFGSENIPYAFPELVRRQYADDTCSCTEQYHICRFRHGILL